jgi:hypothetical protein
MLQYFLFPKTHHGRSAGDAQGLLKFHTTWRSRLVLGPTLPHIQWVQAAQTTVGGVKRPECETNQSLPSSAQVKMHAAIPPLPHTFHGRTTTTLP